MDLSYLNCYYKSRKKSYKDSEREIKQCQNLTTLFQKYSIVIGSTLQIIPAGNMPTYTKKTGKGKLVIINLQATKHDKKADLIIRNYADKIFQALFEKLKMKIPEYDTDVDPVMKVRSGSPSVIGPDFVFKIFSQSSQIFSHKRN